MSVHLLLALVLLAALLPLSAGAARQDYVAGTASGDEYEDQILGAATTAGDVWGGEQGATRTGSTELIPAESPTLHTTSREASWFTRVANLMARVRASLWFLDRD